jgi:hypothetical protein
MRCLFFVGLAALAGCDSEAASDGTGAAGQGGAGGGTSLQPVVTELFPAAAPLPGETECRVVITENLPSFGANHEPVCTPLTYQTNPPSSGDHWPIWAEFRSYTLPVPRQMYVHNLEHGAVVMAYSCGADCPEAPLAFEEAADTFGVDPLCAAKPNGAERSRVIITPDPLLDEPIGIAAWRATYAATCIDPPSILAFLEEHYAKGPENLCTEGKDPNDPLTGVTVCDDR